MPRLRWLVAVLALAGSFALIVAGAAEARGHGHGGRAHGHHGKGHAGPQHREAWFLLR